MHLCAGVAAAFQAWGVTLRIAAIDFLNPAPLMWNFEHGSEAAILSTRYRVTRVTPAACAAMLADGEADLGLIPIGAYAAVPDLLVLPGCAIASLGAIRSLLLVLRTGTEPRVDSEPDLDPPTPAELARIGSVALDTSSRTTALYTQILFRRFWGRTPEFVQHPPDLDGMLASADAAVLIGDPALHALCDRAARYARTGERLRYLDLGRQWQEATGEPWVSAFWAIRREAWKGLNARQKQQLQEDLIRSRDAGLQHIPELVQEWSPRLGLPEDTIRAYLTRNIHYVLDEAAIGGVERFFLEAHELGLLPSLPRIEWASRELSQDWSS